MKRQYYLYLKREEEDPTQDRTLVYWIENSYVWYWLPEEDLVFSSIWEPRHIREWTCFVPIL